MPVPLAASTNNSALAPVNTSAPVVSPTTGLDIGTIVSCTTGSWTNSPTNYSYQWAYNVASILYEFIPAPLPGAPGASTYMLGPSDVGELACGVTASNEYGSATYYSNTFTFTEVALPPIDCSGVAIQAANYYNLAQAWNFTTGSMPPDWSPGASNYGYIVTDYTASQVSITENGCALTAITGGPLGYLSGWIQTYPNFSFQYGRVRFCGQMASISGSWPVGLWPAFWLRDAPSPNVEVDVMEMPIDGVTDYSTLHNWDIPVQAGQGSATISGAMSGYHIYEMVWQPGMITFGFDGLAFAQFTAAGVGADWNFDTYPMYLICNLGVQGGEWGGAPLPNGTTIAAMPLSMLVQSVSIYQ